MFYIRFYFMSVIIWKKVVVKLRNKEILGVFEGGGERDIFFNSFGFGRGIYDRRVRVGKRGRGERAV